MVAWATPSLPGEPMNTPLAGVGHGPVSLRVLRGARVLTLVALATGVAAAGAAQERGFTEIHMDAIAVTAEYGGREIERPGPSYEPGGRGNGGGGGEAGRNGRGRGRGGAATRERPVAVTINGETFAVSEDAEARLKDFLTTYSTNGTVGSFVAATAAVFSAFGLFSIDNSFPAVQAAFKLQSFDADEVLLTLTAPSIWNRAWRAQAVAFCEAEASLAVARRRSNESRMWLHVRDVIANPERYLEGGIQYAPGENRLMLRSLPGEGFRSIAGLDYELTPLDREQLGRLTHVLMSFPASRDYLITADYIQDLGSFRTISKRDKMLLNLALLGLPPGVKAWLEQGFQVNASHARTTNAFWWMLARYRHVEDWENMRGLAGFVDILGFPTNDVPPQSDIVWGEYPVQPLLGPAMPPRWNRPAEGEPVYTFFWVGGR